MKIWYAHATINYYSPYWTSAIRQPSCNHKAIIGQIPVNAVQRGIFGNIHLYQVSVMHQIAGRNVRNVGAALHFFQQFIQPFAAVLKLTLRGLANCLQVTNVNLLGVVLDLDVVRVNFFPGYAELHQLLKKVSLLGNHV